MRSRSRPTATIRTLLTVAATWSGACRDVPIPPTSDASQAESGTDAMSVPTDAQAADATGFETSTADAHTRDASVADVPLIDAPAIDVPVIDASVIDVPVIDVPVIDVPALDASRSDVVDAAATFDVTNDVGARDVITDRSALDTLSSDVARDAPRDIGLVDGGAPDAPRPRPLATDFNGDGRADLAVGALTWETGPTYVYANGPSGLSLQPTLTLDGPFAGSGAGAWAVSVGDLNGDGFADLATATSAGSLPRGQVRIYPGSPAGPSSVRAWTILAAELAPTPFVGINGVVRGVGDLDGDGYGEILVGMSPLSLNEPEGAVLLLRGSADGPRRTAMSTLRMPNNPVDQCAASNPNCSFGFALAVADVNGDGRMDAVVGAPGAIGPSAGPGAVPRRGRVYVYFGTPSGYASAPSQTLEAPAPEEAFASVIERVGDVNGDGRADIAVGAARSGFVAGVGATGRVYLYLGTPSGLAATPRVIESPEAGNVGFGFAMVGCDLDRDGVDDLVVSALPRGRVYVFSGGAEGPARARWVLENTTHRFFGQRLAAPGDLDGDGAPDLVVSAVADTGAVYVYAARPGGPSLTPTLQRVAPVAGQDFGYGIAASR
jgi:hypothetical protein